MTDLELFDAARKAGLSPVRAARYVRHVRLREAGGRTPLTPESAALACSTVAAKAASTARRPSPQGDTTK